MKALETLKKLLASINSYMEAAAIAEMRVDVAREALLSGPKPAEKRVAKQNVIKLIRNVRPINDEKIDLYHGAN
ncbi:MAG: hypothetical protein HQL03_12205 [Nitrospirae bacterium]|nr:hypothetical protein [Nitrospirota bacterium]MBF0592110.1 hypothetical protein [Nitrospirota bacterium]